MTRVAVSKKAIKVVNNSKVTMNSLQSTHPSAVFFSGRQYTSEPVPLVQYDRGTHLWGSFGIVVVSGEALAASSCDVSPRPCRVEEAVRFPRLTARVQDFLRVNSSIVSERSALSNSDRRMFFARHTLFCRRPSNPHSSRPFRIISSAVKTTTIVMIVVVVVVGDCCR
jgi:hypothetical protein